MNLKSKRRVGNLFRLSASGTLSPFIPTDGILIVVFRRSAGSRSREVLLRLSRPSEVPSVWSVLFRFVCATLTLCFVLNVMSITQEIFTTAYLVVGVATSFFDSLVAEPTA